MFPDGVAIFLRDALSGEEQPVEFTWGSDAESLERVWNAAVKKLSARDAEELRREGYYARLVSLSPLTEDDLGQRGFIESCLRRLDIAVERGECTSEAGNEKVTQPLVEATLKTETIHVPLHQHEPALPEFSAEYLDCRDEGDIEMSLQFVLQTRTATHAIYSVREWEPQPGRLRGKMAASSTTLRSSRRLRKQG